ncbi:MAG TPA: AbrB/MazE/SpoVT family DNA-binding domain-containing protein [Thermomicrobiales bacterium]|nr:AbrB/MazE/SpoVT family DNA-binding domain-containing protein [Thermomicrobiales bacterium]
MKEFVSTVSSKGQVTIPADIRRRLGVNSSDKVAFVLTDEGKVELRPARYSLESVLGSLDALPNETLDLDAEIDIAAEEAAAQRMRRLERGR